MRTSLGRTLALITAAALAATGCGSSDEGGASKDATGASRPTISAADRTRLDAAEPIRLEPNPDVPTPSDDAVRRAAQLLEERFERLDIVNDVRVDGKVLELRLTKPLPDEQLENAVLVQGRLSMFQWEEQVAGGTLYRSRAGAESSLESLIGEAQDVRIVHGPPEQMQGNGITIDDEGRFDRALGLFAVLDGPPTLGNEIVRSAEVTNNPNQIDVKQAVQLNLTDEGAEAFEAFTAETARTGGVAGTPHRITFVIDDEVASVPSIDYRQYPRGIAGDVALITELETEDDARYLAATLDVGPLPYPLIIN